MNYQHITLESLFVNEETEKEYARQIAEEDIKESYGTEAIL